MCRIAARVGPPARLSTVLYDQPRALHELAVEPAEMRSGRINVDGTGVAWFAPPGAEADGGVGADGQALSYRTAAPPWSDANLAGLSTRLTSHVVLAAVRATTPGIPQGAAFVHPFTSGDLAGTHNGWVSDFRSRVARPLMAEVSDATFGELTGMSDANVLFLLAVDAHRAGATLREAAEEATRRTIKVCEAQGATATLTLALADPTGVVVVNAAHGRQANSLYACPDLAGGIGIASEPLDPALDWTPVPDGGAVTALHPDPDTSTSDPRMEITP